MNHVVDEVPEVLRDIAMATNFSLLLTYNFGCIASDTLFDSIEVGFRGDALCER